MEGNHSTDAAKSHPTEYEEPIWDEVHMLPLAKIMETMQKALPANVGAPSDVAQIIQEGTSDFILLVTSQARERCQQEKRQKIKGDDIIWALRKLGFTNYVTPLEHYLSRYKDARSTGNNTAQSSTPSKKKKDSGASTSHATNKSS